MRKSLSLALVGLMLFSAIVDAAPPIRVVGRNNTVQVVNGGGAPAAASIAAARGHLAGVPAAGLHAQAVVIGDPRLAAVRVVNPGYHHSYRARLEVVDPAISYGYRYTYTPAVASFDPGYYAAPAVTSYRYAAQFDPGYSVAPAVTSYRYAACGCANAAPPPALPTLAPAESQQTVTTTTTTTTVTRTTGP